MAVPRSRFPSYPPDLAPGLQLYLEALRNEIEAAGTFYANVTAAGTGANTAETDLMRSALPELLDKDSVEIIAQGTVAGVNNTKTIKLYIGATAIATIGPIVAGTTGKWFFRGHFTKDGVTSHITVLQTPLGLPANPGAVENSTTESVAENLSYAFLKVTGTTTNAADEVTQERLIVRISRAPQA